MRRVSTLLSLFGVVLIGVLTLGHGVIAQEATPAGMAHHPIVGTWRLDTDTESSEDPPELAIISADGAWIEVDAEGAVSIGRWESTGPQTANMTLWGLGGTEEGDFGGTFIIRASIEVAADGQTFTASYTGEFIGPDGASEGEYGPGTATATRLAVEPMGEPVGSFEELFGQFEEASPEASPAP